MARLPRSRTVRSILREHERQLRVQGSASVLARSGLSVPDENVTQVDGDLVVVGDFTAEGKISNAALTNPVLPQTVWQRATGFAVSVPWTSVITKTVTVPDGFTTADIDARARVTAFYNNVGTGVDYLYAILYIDSADSEFYPLAVSDNGGSGTNQVFRNVVLTGLTGGQTITLDLQASTGFNTWTSPYGNNVAQLGVSIRWTR